MKNKKNILWEVWTTFPNSGRPNRFLGYRENYSDAVLLASEHEENNPCDTARVGVTCEDSDGFLQWDSSFEKSY